MVIFAGLSVLLLILAALFIAIKTFVLWTRTKGLPELLLSLYLTGATVLGYPLTIVSSRIPSSEMWFLHFASELVMSLGFACLLFFTMKVFRPGVLWARCLVGLALLPIAIGTVDYLLELTSGHPQPMMEMTGLILFISGPVGFAYFWTTFESLRYYGRLKLQLRLGLSEPVVVNRMWLWGFMTLFAGIAVIINIAATVAGAFLSPPVVLVSSLLGLGQTCCLFLAFHPPAWYRGWLERQTPAEAR